MPDVTFSQSDILQATTKLEATWYLASLKKCEAGPGKKDPSSTTWSCEFEITEGNFKGLPISFWFSDKMPKTIISFVSCFVAKVEAGKSYPLESAIGKPVKIFARYNMEQKNNEILDFQKV